MPSTPVSWTRAVLPFAGAYFLSYLYRTANAVIGPVLQSELSLSASAIGLLTGAYFLPFAAAQVPLGMLLDRFGARRVESAVLLVGAAGAAIFAAGSSLPGLAAGRALIGLGVSACLMAPFKAFSRMFPAERQGSLTGWIMTAGGLGAVTAAYPLEVALRITSWREIFAILAAATFAASAWIFLRVPRRDERSDISEPLAAQWRGVLTVFGSGRFWRSVPMGIAFQGGYMAVQGLWATGWLMGVSGYTRAVAAEHVTGMSVAMLLTYLAIGVAATPLARRGIPAGTLAGGGLLLSLATLLAIVTGASAHTRALWVAYSAFSCFGTLLYAATAQRFPVELAGRANTALNVVVMSGAFGVQWGVGVVVDVVRGRGGDAAAGLRTAFWILIAMQAFAYVCYVATARWAADARRAARAAPG